ncbi:MAG: PorP/SprF family type IX secretion system membrane protein [Bacteroidetes bacterium]|nr:PorP/SprF family type IX secretion system membrane protein [Bacteroidota bacterium]
MGKVKYIIVLFAGFLISVYAHKGIAQDLHFSQFMHAPMLTNPANAGFIPEADYRVGGMYRSQWTALNVPFSTAHFFADFQLLRNRLENGWIGVGVSAFRDVAGKGQLRNNQQYVTVAYHQMLGFSSLLSGGFNMGYTTKSIDITRFIFDNQWNGKFFDAAIPNGETTFQTGNISYADLQAGLNYAYFPSEKAYLNFGVSAHHLNQANESFLATNNRIPIRWLGFANGSFKWNDWWILNPNAYYSNQAGAYELVFGMNATHNLLGDGSFLITGGAYYRWGDAAIAMLGFEKNNFKFTATYDATISLLRPFNQTRGAWEFSLIKNGFYGKTNQKLLRQSMCPSF